MSGLVDAAREVRERGSFSYLDRLVPGAGIARLMQSGAGQAGIGL